MCVPVGADRVAKSSLFPHGEFPWSVAPSERSQGAPEGLPVAAPFGGGFGDPIRLLGPPAAPLGDEYTGRPPSRLAAGIVQPIQNRGCPCSLAKLVGERAVRFDRRLSCLQI